MRFNINSSEDLKSIHSFHVSERQQHLPAGKAPNFTNSWRSTCEVKATSGWQDAEKPKVWVISSRVTEQILDQHMMKKITWIFTQICRWFPWQLHLPPFLQKVFMFYHRAADVAAIISFSRVLFFHQKYFGVFPIAVQIKRLQPRPLSAAAPSPSLKSLPLM